MEQPDEVVLYAAARGVARITLNRPDRLNASNGAVSRGLTAAFTRAGADPEVRVVLLCGAGRAFCAGADMAVLGELSADPAAPNSGSGGLRYDGIMLLDKPVIAAVHGACAGIGLAMACAADIRIAAEDAVFVAPFARLGLCAEGGLAWSLARLMGQGHAAEMLLTARRVGGAEALARGLVSQLLPAQGFAEAALAYAESLAQGSPASFAMIKRQLRDADGQDFETARAASMALTRETLDGPDFKEAMAALRGKRAARMAGLSVPFAPPVSNG
ncbi:enoyl-CoA hydratase-related protein [Novosphingobium sp.]|uniref:enoyl-CoA hydratase-related protein n=1 Tax=Novosphingobium sp. TaxID=1874826 RepID=UPI001EC8A40F|nr:enoyl-CoA hydratase-related protein [Novosphingobium sp.]MBK9012042.1 enoyl-CoA hydratase/isomerase family protein [Novosphingobium sp.]